MTTESAVRCNTIFYGCGPCHTILFVNSLTIHIPFVDIVVATVVVVNLICYGRECEVTTYALNITFKYMGTLLL